MALSSIPRTAVVELLNNIGLKNAHLLSTKRLERKVNQLDKLLVNENNLDKKCGMLFNHVIKVLDMGGKIEVIEDRDNVPQQGDDVDISQMRRRERKLDIKFDVNLLYEGKILELTKGEDFTCHKRSLITALRVLARKRNMKLKTQSDKDKLVVMMYTPSKENQSNEQREIR